MSFPQLAPGGAFPVDAKAEIRFRLYWLEDIRKISMFLLALPSSSRPPCLHSAYDFCFLSHILINANFIYGRPRRGSISVDLKWLRVFCIALSVMQPNDLGNAEREGAKGKRGLE